MNERALLFRVRTSCSSPRMRRYCLTAFAGALSLARHAAAQPAPNETQSEATATSTAEQPPAATPTPPQPLPAPATPPAPTPERPATLASTPGAVPADASQQLTGNSNAQARGISTVVRVAVDFPGAWLETRPFGSHEPWTRLCAVPCGAAVRVDGVEARVTAPAMTPSAPFRIQAGAGAALLDVRGGSASLRSWGRVSFALGVPISLLGMAGFGYGSFEDRPGLRGAGAVSLGVGAALVLTALPLLVAGTTNVRNEHGDLIADSGALLRF